MAAVIHPAPRTDPRSRPRPPLRLIQGGRSSQRRAKVYRRRRILAGLVVLAVGMLAVVGSQAALHALVPEVPGAHPSRPSIGADGGSSTGVAVTVRRGDTLWSIARRLTPDGDVRAVVDRLAAVHGTGPLQVGERLPISAATGG